MGTSQKSEEPPQFVPPFFDFALIKWDVLLVFFIASGGYTFFSETEVDNSIICVGWDSRAETASSSNFFNYSSLDTSFCHGDILWTPSIFRVSTWTIFSR